MVDLNARALVELAIAVEAERSVRPSQDVEISSERRALRAETFDLLDDLRRGHVDALEITGPPQIRDRLERRRMRAHERDRIVRHRDSIVSVAPREEVRHVRRLAAVERTQDVDREDARHVAVEPFAHGGGESPEIADGLAFGRAADRPNDLRFARERRRLSQSKDDGLDPIQSDEFRTEFDERDLAARFAAHATDDRLEQRGFVRRRHRRMPRERDDRVDAERHDVRGCGRCARFTFRRRTSHRIASSASRASARARNPASPASRDGQPYLTSAAAMPIAIATAARSSGHRHAASSAPRHAASRDASKGRCADAG